MTTTFRQQIDAHIDALIERFSIEVQYADPLQGDSTIDLDYSKLLQTYFDSALEDDEHPLASLVSSYFIEYTSQCIQLPWLERARDQTDFVWDVLSTFITTKDDEQVALRYVDSVYKLFAQFFTELYEDKIGKVTDSPKVFRILGPHTSSHGVENHDGSISR